MKPRKPVLPGQLGDTDLRLLRIYRWIRDGLMRTLNPVEYRYITQYSAITRKGAPSNLVLESYLEELDQLIETDAAKA